MLVDPNAVVYPTPKSDGAAQFVSGLHTLNEQEKVGANSDDLDNFSDINSQDDALTREKKE